MNNMKNNWVIFLLFVFFGLCRIVYSGESEHPKEVVTTFNIFPNEVQVGDTVYLSIQHFNNTETEFPCRIPRIGVYEEDGDPIRYFLVIDEKKLEIVSYVDGVVEVDEPPPTPLVIRPGETKIILAREFRIVDLEDFNNKFWIDLIQNLPDTGKDITFQVELVTTKYPLQVIHGKEQLILSKKIRLIPRKKKELTTLKNWYVNTPEETFSELYEVKLKSEYQPIWQRKVLRQHYKSLQETEINPNLKYILRVGNRYPGYPNLPNDWQGWKKLEESFEPSTLQDEIRWTRICLQYCTTADAKVLDELKTWLEKMNPIQRSVMINYFHKNEKLSNSAKLYETIQLFKDKK